VSYWVKQSHKPRFCLCKPTHVVFVCVTDGVCLALCMPVEAETLQQQVVCVRVCVYMYVCTPHTLCLCVLLMVWCVCVYRSVELESLQQQLVQAQQETHDVIAQSRQYVARTRQLALDRVVEELKEVRWRCAGVMRVCAVSGMGCVTAPAPQRRGVQLDTVYGGEV